MYSAGKETEVVPNTFEEATNIDSLWVSKINAETSIGQPRLVSTALERVAIVAKHRDLRHRAVSFGERAGIDGYAEH